MHELPAESIKHLPITHLRANWWFLFMDYWCRLCFTGCSWSTQRVECLFFFFLMQWNQDWWHAKTCYVCHLFDWCLRSFSVCKRSVWTQQMCVLCVSLGSWFVGMKAQWQEMKLLANRLMFDRPIRICKWSDERGAQGHHFLLSMILIKPNLP